MAGDAASITQEYFDRVYQESQDPWDFESSEYEREKYEASLRALPKQRYNNALEIGCSIGVFTAKLALRCSHLLSIDIAAAAVDRAKRRCEKLRHVRFEVMPVPDNYPSGLFDLTVLSEVGYYLTAEHLTKLSKQITDHAIHVGHLLLVHRLEPVPGFPLQGDDVHELFLSLPTWRAIRSSRTDQYRIDLLERHAGFAELP